MSHVLTFLFGAMIGSAISVFIMCMMIQADDSKEWYEEPCDGCCHAHSGFERKDEEGNLD